MCNWLCETHRNIKDRYKARSKSCNTGSYALLKTALVCMMGMENAKINQKLKETRGAFLVLLLPHLLEKVVRSCTAVYLLFIGIRSGLEKSSL